MVMQAVSEGTGPLEGSWAEYLLCNPVFTLAGKVCDQVDVWSDNIMLHISDYFSVIHGLPHLCQLCVDLILKTCELCVS